MSRNPLIRIDRNKDIATEYKRLSSEKVKNHSGKPTKKYRHAAILVLLSEKFYLSAGTIQNILTSFKYSKNGN